MDFSLSPDGRWLAYSSNESGREEVYVRPFPPGPGKWVVSRGGGNEPRWAHNGRELFYRSADGFMVATVRTTPTFAVTSIELLFVDVYQRDGTHQQYDVMPDDQSFVMVRAEANQRRLTLVLNWFEELKAKVGN